jgi:hypothetical protein
VSLLGDVSSRFGEPPRVVESLSVLSVFLWERRSYVLDSSMTGMLNSSRNALVYLTSGGYPLVLLTYLWLATVRTWRRSSVTVITGLAWMQLTMSFLIVPMNG